MTPKICVVTGSRAEYGLLRGLIGKLFAAEDLDLQLVVTGMHLSASHGHTFREIEQDGFTISRKVDMEINADTACSITRSMGLGLQRMGVALDELKPDLLIVLGDRFETLAVVSAALISRVPVAHLHGGEVTEGAFDDSIRHAITKMSHLHFVAAEPYRRRVVQLGEQPSTVFNVGSLGAESILSEDLMSRDELEDTLGFRFLERNLLVTFHPVTLAGESSASLMTEFLAALECLDDTRLVFTMPNADTEGLMLARMIADFVAIRENAVAFTSLGRRRYLSCMRCVDGVVGNSSSGLLEAPLLSVGTVNVGDRQSGRIKADSVIDCEVKRDEIRAAVARLYDSDYRGKLSCPEVSDGQRGVADSVVDLIRRNVRSIKLSKRFYDIAQLGTEALTGRSR